MTHSEHGRLDNREHVAPQLSEERLASVWFSLSSEQRRRSQRTRRGMFVAAGALTAAAAALLLVWRLVPEPARAPDQWAGTVLRTADTPLQVALSDGSRVDAKPATVLELLHGGKREMRFALRRGSASFAVKRNKRRAFVVQAGSVRVRVVGTRFSVSRSGRGSGERVAVAVTRGIVEVSHGGQTIRLTAGQRWSRGRGPLASRQTAAGAASKQAPPDKGSARANDDSAPAPSSPRRVRRRRHADKSARRVAAAQLFERASKLRRAGQHRAAERAYARFLARHEGDARATLVAFELGRLRMDQLGDARGAVRALRRVLSSKRAVMREDALARLVLLYGRLGQKRACRHAKTRYLRAYPTGRYSAHLADRCR